MKARTLIAAAFSVTAAVWILFSWPLPRYVFTGIPYAAKNVSDFRVIQMVPGDHLQLEYNFWLFSTMVKGKTPFFYDIYQFNTGDDAQRYKLTWYYTPFSLMYTVAAWIGGRAFGWNTTAFLSLVFTFLLTFLLCARYSDDRWISLCAALVSICLPYRWITLLGGSPTGFGMMWVPLVFFGIDKAVRDENIWGGIGAGAGILGAYFGDTHVFFFSVLAVPFWFCVAAVMRDTPLWKDGRTMRRVCAALVPVAIFTVAAYCMTTNLRSSVASSQHMAGGRRMSEVAAFSPVWQGFFAWKEMGIANHIYLGFILPLILAAGCGLSLYKGIFKKRQWSRRDWALFFICMGCAGVAVLSLGPKVPVAGPRVFHVIRKLIPHYGLIRQPAKIFSLMPAMLSVGFTLGIALFSGMTEKIRVRRIIACGCVLMLLIEYKAQIQASVCTLDPYQGAYESAAAEARRHGRPPRLIVLPLWPGDSHYSSVYEYYVSLYGIRMINGYSPVVPQSYYEDVFLGYESMNRGIVSDEQLNSLLGRGIEFIVIHEDLFPEKVSPFPVSFTLKRLMEHRRLAFLTRDGTVWAFRILRHPRSQVQEMPAWDMFFPARRWEAEQSKYKGEEGDSGDASGGRYVTVHSVDAGSIRFKSTGVPQADRLRFMIRLRGKGSIKAVVKADGDVSAEKIIPVNSSGWVWEEIAFMVRGLQQTGLRCGVLDGGVDIDMALLAAGNWTPPEKGDVLVLPGALFFHAGCTDLSRNSVVFNKDRDRAESIVLYGPGLPFPKGKYEIEIVCDTEAPAGTPLARFVVAQGDERSPFYAITAGSKGKAFFTQTTNLPVSIHLIYERQATLAVRQVVFRRIV